MLKKERFTTVYHFAYISTTQHVVNVGMLHEARTTFNVTIILLIKNNL